MLADSLALVENSLRRSINADSLALVEALVRPGALTLTHLRWMMRFVKRMRDSDALVDALC